MHDFALEKDQSSSIVNWASLQDAPQSSEGIRRRDIAPYIAGIVTFSTTLLIYLLTLAPDITWAFSGADGGELITAAVTLGVPHPPGYPLYTVLGKLASFLPLGTVAFRFNLLSSFSMAAAAGLLAFSAGTVCCANKTSDTATHLPSNPKRTAAPLWTGIFAGSLFAFSPIVWQQAVIAEVYAVNMLMVSAFVAIVLGRQRTSKPGLSVSVMQGIALTTHMTSLLLLPVSLVTIRARQWPRFFGGLILGLAPFLLLFQFGNSGSPVIWGWPGTLRGWWWVISGKIYHRNVLAFPLERWPERLSVWIAEPTFWIVLALFVVIFIGRRSPADYHAAQSHVLAISAALYVLYAFTYDAGDSLVLLSPAIAILCLLAADALPRPTPWYLLLPLALLVLNFSGINVSEHSAARTLAEFTLREAPPDSIVLTSGDRATFTLWYLQHVEGQREDLVIIDQDLIAFDWYRTRLASANPGLRGLASDDIELLRRLNENTHAWCEVRFEHDRIGYFRCKEPT